jgi:two-component system sensor histidine kinase DesK
VKPVWRAPFWGPGPWGERPWFQRTAMRGVWVAFVIFPLVNAATSRASITQKVAVIVATVLFVAGYAGLVGWQRQASDARAAVVLAGMLALAALLTALQGAAWGFLFIYCSACCGLLRGSRLGFTGVAVCTTLAALVPALSGGGYGDSIGYGASSAGIGLLMLLIRDLRVRNDQLSEARAELAQTAVARERERFARDLHDLLGHSLSVIAIKAELARRLAPIDGERAAAEVADIESVARQALAEVRDAVSGFRRPTLDVELEGARVALEAAGIEAEVERPSVELNEDVEAVLGWAVREGATNVIRHSAARRCSVRLTADLERAGLEVLDDGRGPNGAGAGGNGLAGLRDRVAAVRGSVDAGPQAGGGFRLFVEVPLTGSRA